MSSSNSSWLAKWQYIINKISQLVKEHGKEIVVFNVEAIPDPVEQFKKYEMACETVKGIYEAVITTSLLDEERFFGCIKMYSSISERAKKRFI